MVGGWVSIFLIIFLWQGSAFFTTDHLSRFFIQVGVYFVLLY
jgi:hypothetical protein